jgi:hypothetical protein
MRIDRAAHLPWLLFVLVASAIAALLFIAQLYPQRVPTGFRFFGEAAPEHGTIGGTPLGLIFGTVSLALFVFAALLGMRKRLPFLRIGHVQRWLRAHIWLTLLTVPLVLLHSGFRLGGPMTTLLMVLYAVVMLSGIYGLILQHKMPTLMKERLPAEIVYEQIPNIRAQLCAAAERLQRSYQGEFAMETGERTTRTAAPSAVPASALPDVSEHAVVKTPSAVEKPMGGGTVRGTLVAPAAIIESEAAGENADPLLDRGSENVLAEFIERELLPYLRAGRGEKFRLGHARQAEEIFRFLRVRVAAPYRVRVDEMQGWCDERRLLDAQVRMQHWLHGWLLVHAPVSFLLVFIAAWHAFVTLFHY